MEDDTLYSDDLSPTDGSVFRVAQDEELTTEINAEKAMVQSAGPLLNMILAWFDAEISAADSISGLELESEINLSAQVLARQLLKTKLEGARDRLHIMKDEYVK